MLPSSSSEEEIKALIGKESKRSAGPVI